MISENETLDIVDFEMWTLKCAKSLLVLAEMTSGHTIYCTYMIVCIYDMVKCTYCRVLLQPPTV